MAALVAADLRRQFPGITLRMVGTDAGDGSLWETRQLVDDLDLQRNVTIGHGVPKHEVPYVLATADVFLNTTHFDNAPVSVVEAMACGMCIVSTDVEAYHTSWRMAVTACLFQRAMWAPWLRPCVGF